MEIKELLEQLGYKLKVYNDYYSCPAVFRGGDNETSLAIYPQKNLCIDFVTGQKFSINKLIGLTLKTESDEEIAKYLKDNEIVLNERSNEVLIPTEKIYSPDVLKKLLPIHDYWIKRGIDLDVLKEFKGGLAGKEGRLRGRYVFGVFDGESKVVGFAGRDVTNKSPAYWKLWGAKSIWKYPLFLNYKELKKNKRVILVEGISDCLSLFTCGIRNVVCLFGVHCSDEILKLLIRYDMEKIYIGTNNDFEKNNVGNKAAIEIKKRLSHFFDGHQIRITLPPKHKDFNRMLVEEGKRSIIDWYDGINK